jgi:glycerol uptake facilitator-like aquaporin
VKPLVAEIIGTFLLTLAVSLSLLVDLGVPTPIVAALTVGLCVYTLGPVSGAHFNPAVTVGLLCIRAITLSRAVMYIVVQVLAAVLAMAVVHYLNQGPLPRLPLDNDVFVLAAEAMGAFILLFGITSVVRGAAPSQASGLVIGGSLLLGILVASVASNGVLNPAVALGIGSLNLMYVIGPVLGGVLGALCYDWVGGKR